MILRFQIKDTPYYLKLLIDNKDNKFLYELELQDLMEKMS